MVLLLLLLLLLLSFCIDYIIVVNLIAKRLTAEKEKIKNELNEIINDLKAEKDKLLMGIVVVVIIVVFIIL